MAKRPSIKAAVDAVRRENTRTAPEPNPPKSKAASATAAPAPAPRVARSAAKPPSREGKVNISAFFMPEVRKSLRLVQAQTDANTTELLGEALNLLFQKYGVPACAPERSQD